MTVEAAAGRDLQRDGRRAATGDDRHRALLGAPGPARGRRRASWPSGSASRTSSTGDLFRAAVRDGSRDRPRGAPLHGARPARARRDHDPRCSSIGSRRPMPPAASILDGFPRNRPQAEALDARSPSAAAGSIARCTSTCPTDELVRRLSGRWVCRDSGHVYNERPTRRGSPACATSTARRSIQRDDDQPETIRARLAQQLASLLRGRRPLPRARGSCATSTAASPSTRSPTPCSPTSSAGDAGRGLTWSPASRAPRSSGCAAPAAIVAEVLALVEAELKPGVSTAHLDALAEAHIRKAGRDPVVQGLPRHQPAPAVPGQRVHLDRRRDRPRHPRRADASGRPDRVGRRRRHRRRLARRRRPDLLRRRAAARGRASSSTRPARR